MKNKKGRGVIRRLVLLLCVIGMGLCSCRPVSSGPAETTVDQGTDPGIETEGKTAETEKGGELTRAVDSDKLIHLKYKIAEDPPYTTLKDYAAMTFGEGGSGQIVTNNDRTWGNAELTADDTVKIAYAKRTNLYVYYMAKVKFNVGDYASTNWRYVRVLYRAKNPTGTDKVSMLIENDSNGERYLLQEVVTDTNGEFVLSDTALLSFEMVNRFMTKLHNSIILNPKGTDGEYEIKAIYFFASRQGAESFSPLTSDHTVTINGNDISNYQIVVARDATVNVMTYVEKLSDHIETITGNKLPIVTDESKPEKYEIRIGRSSRGDTVKATDTFAYFGKLEGDAYIVSGGSTMSVAEGVKRFLETVLYEGKTTIPDAIAVTADQDFADSVSGLTKVDLWEIRPDADEPARIEMDLDRDEGLLTCEGPDVWSYTGGTYRAAKSGGTAVSYIPVYEQNAEISAEVTFREVGAAGGGGILLRSTSPHAYVRAGYDFEAEEWFIETREGLDFYPERRASQNAKIGKGKTYTLTLSVRGYEAALSVDGKKILTASGLDQVSPGRPGVFADRAGVCFDNIALTLYSGQGHVFKNMSHTVLPGEVYREGGTVIERDDGSLTYLHSSGLTYTSRDEGKTWSPAETWTDAMGNPNVLRLTSEALLKIGGDGGKIVSLISRDDGESWTRTGTVCSATYKATKASAGNMNDHVTQSAVTGRIFYVQGYEAPAADPVDGRIVFCEFYYSDDEGKTWTRSETGSWQITGQTYFDEGKIIECADGTLRMYSSWNDLGYIVYSESHDNGVTWGQVVRMSDFACSRSSMQIVRDPYAENDTTYYMVWSDSKPDPAMPAMSRAALTLAKSTDGKSWTVIGDVWRWESRYKGTLYGTYLNHMVDPFINVTRDAILVGAGISESWMIDGAGDNSYHFAQRQHIFRFDKE